MSESITYGYLYHSLSRFEIDGEKRISQHLSNRPLIEFGLVRNCLEHLNLGSGFFLRRK